MSSSACSQCRVKLAGLPVPGSTASKVRCHQYALSIISVDWATNSVSLRMPNFKGPVAWLRESLAPNVRQQNTKEEIEEARKQAAEKGQLSVFESVPTVEAADGEDAEEVPAWRRKKYTEVRGVQCSQRLMD